MILITVTVDSTVECCMGNRIDGIDARILELLEADGRTPAAHIAKEVGLSRPAVAERISKLEEAGVILGVVAVVDPLARGLDITAFVSAKSSEELSGSRRESFEEFLERDDVLEVHKIAGEDCYLFKVRTDSISSLNTLIMDLSSCPISMTTKTTIVMDTFCEKTGRIDREKARNAR